MNPPPVEPGVKLRRPLSSATLDEDDDFGPTKNDLKLSNGSETTKSHSSSSWLSGMFQCKPPSCSFGDDDFNYTIMLGSSPSTKIEKDENSQAITCEAQTQTEEIYLVPMNVPPQKAGCACIIS